MTPGHPNEPLHLLTSAGVVQRQGVSVKAAQPNHFKARIPYDRTATYNKLRLYSPAPRTFTEKPRSMAYMGTKTGAICCLRMGTPEHEDCRREATGLIFRLANLAGTPRKYA
jgi:hypothetical protein